MAPIGPLAWALPYAAAAALEKAKRQKKKKKNSYLVLQFDQFLTTELLCCFYLGQTINISDSIEQPL